MKIRSYAKSELAMLYFPNSNPHVATNHLTQWIKRCPPLVAALAGCYQSKNAKFFSPQAVRHIVEFLGEP
jgi:hypothetical protein